jgi:sigma-B regulation protein RsbU (phosphoserine phosphatase)
MSETLIVVPEKPVLVVDDIASARMVLIDMLGELGVSSYLEASNGQGALDILKQHEVSLIFCDFIMDGMNGIEFLQALKTHQLSNTAPVIFVSAMGDVASVEEALKLGAADYLVKPLNFRKLKRKIDNTLSRVNQSPGHQISAA